jgi:hypothetical protein
MRLKDAVDYRLATQCSILVKDSSHYEHYLLRGKHSVAGMNVMEALQPRSHSDEGAPATLIWVLQVEPHPRTTFSGALAHFIVMNRQGA